MTMKLTVGFSTHIIGDHATINQLAETLFSTTDEAGRATSFSVSECEDVEQMKAVARADKLAEDAMREKEKSWLSQYQRAENLQKQLDELKKAQEA